MPCISSVFASCNVSHIKRDGNRVAHALAKFAYVNKKSWSFDYKYIAGLIKLYIYIYIITESFIT